MMTRTIGFIGCLFFLLTFLSCNKNISVNNDLSVFEMASYLGYGAPQQDCLGRADVPEKPHIILIIVDDANYADFPYGGYGLIDTPWINSIAENGVLFNNGYVASPLCSPSRAALMTSRPFWQNGVPENIFLKSPDRLSLPLSEKTIAEYLKEADYDTAFFGKWHLGYLDEFHAKEQGFDHYWLLRHGDASYFSPYNRGDIPQVDSNIKQPVSEKLGIANLYLTDLLALEAINFIDTQQTTSEKPFFITLSFNAVHGPIEAKNSTLRKLTHIDDEFLKKYLAMVVALDEAIGALLSYLNNTGLCNDVLLFFINDNGGVNYQKKGYIIPNNGELKNFKGTYSEGGIRVPFMLQWIRNLSKNLVYEHMVSSYDILPTILAAVEEAPAEDLPITGVNLLPVLSSEEAGKEPAHDCLFWMSPYHARWQVVRCGKWKLIFNENPNVPDELYDLDKDVGEKMNLLLDSSEAMKHTDTVNDLKAKLAAWLSETGFE